MIIISGQKKNLVQRYYAGLLDYLIILIFVVVYVYLAGDVNDEGTYRVTGFKALLIPVVWFFYFPVCEGIMGQTIGKKAFHLHVVNVTGERTSIGQAFLRRVVDPVEMVFFGIAAILIINFSDKNQKIGDMMAGTTVVRTDVICGLCGTELELTPIEVIRDTFTCPNCKQTIKKS
jgi:uncharacterized RDD family membrane protein YckC